MILNRITPLLDQLLRDSQNGFRQKRSTVRQILALRRVLEGVRGRNLSAVIIFIDFKKAFDTIHRGKLFKILRAYGIPKKPVQAISATYSKTQTKVPKVGRFANLTERQSTCTLKYWLESFRETHCSTLSFHCSTRLCTQARHSW